MGIFKGHMRPLVSSHVDPVTADSWHCHHVSMCDCGRCSLLNMVHKIQYTTYVDVAMKVTCS